MRQFPTKDRTLRSKTIESDDMTDGPVSSDASSTERQSGRYRLACLQSVISFVLLLAGFWALYLAFIRVMFPSGYTRNVFMEIGSSVSAISCCIVVFSFIFKRRYRRHPNPILFWKSITDLIFALRFLGALDTAVGPHVCHFLGAIGQFCSLSSECWFACIYVDLWFSATNPFTNTQRNLISYHIFSWTTGAFSAVVWSISSPRFDLSGGDYCYFNDVQSPMSWILYYGPVIVFLTCAVIVIIGEQRAHRTGGMKETINIRRDVVTSLRIVTIAYSVYQLLSMSLWIVDSYLKEGTSADNVITSFSALFHGSKGFIDLIAWFAINGPIHAFGLCCVSKSTSNDVVENEVDVDLQPQLNVALRQEVLHFTTRGIIAATTHAARTTKLRRLVKLRIHEMDLSVRFNDYEAKAFREIRHGFGLDDETYKLSFDATCHERMQSGGSSGAFMFYTADYSFLVKSITKSERSVLLRMLPAYMNHLKDNPNSHLTKFFGCHSIHMYGQSFSFVVMGNVIGRLSMHEFYDIKGSYIDRHAEAIPLGKTVICTYCSLAFKMGSADHCEYSINGYHTPHVVLKDNDLRKKLRIPQDKAKDLVSEISKDSAFLRDQGITDYSLLLSVHSTKYLVDDDSIDIEQKPSKRRVFHAKCHKDSSFSSLSNDSLTSTIISDPGAECDKFEDPSSNSRPRLPNNRAYRFSVVREEGTTTNELTPLVKSADSSSMEYLEQGTPILVRTPRVYTSNTPHVHEWTGTRHYIQDGFKACAVVGPDYYTVGIIDILQTWTWQKRFERFWKVYVLRYNSMGVSAAPPRFYSDRFMRKVEDIAMVAHPTSVGLFQH